MENAFFAICSTVYVLGGFHLFGDSVPFLRDIFDVGMICVALTTNFYVFRDLLARASRFLAKVLPDPDAEKKVE